MENTVIGGLLLFGGIYVSLGNNKTQGTILLLTLLLIVSISILTSLQPSNQSNTNEYFEDTSKNEPKKDESKKVQPKKDEPVESNPNNKPVTASLQKPLPMPLTVETPKPSGSEAQAQGTNQLKQPPNPPLNKIIGYADNTIESIKFYDTNDNVSTSGTSEKGKPFNFQCANNGKIVGYDYNSQGNERDDSSILGGLGPVYCADGSILDTVVGKEKNNSLGKTSKSN
jgi:hypothetical protein